MSASKKRSPNFLFSLIFGITVAATSVAAVKPVVLNVGNGPDVKTLDPNTAQGVYEMNIIMQIFDGLVDYDPKTAGPIPGLAESWKVSKDGRTYTFKLRKNAKWSNGDPVTAADFVYSLERLVTPGTAAENAYQAYIIVGAEKFNKGEEKDPKTLGVKAVDPYTLEYKLKDPAPYFVSLVQHYAFYPIHKATVAKHGDRWTRPENIVTSGAYKLASWELNKNVKLVKDPNNWDAANVKIDEVNFVTTENMDTEEKMFRTGLLHVTNWVSPEKLPFWQKDTSGVFKTGPWLGNLFYILNNKKPPFNDARVRKALGYAIDREKLVKYVTKGNEQPLLSQTPPGTGGFEPPANWPKDLSRVSEAKKLLAEAGYGPGGKKLTFEILYNTEERNKKMAEAVQAMWKENLGVEAALVNQEWKVFLDSRHQGKYDVARYGWIGDFNDPVNFLNLFRKGYGQNESFYESPKFEEAMDKAAKETNLKKRLSHLRDAENILGQDAAFIPIYVQTKNFLVSKDVVGWYPNILNLRRVKWVSLK